MKNNWLDNPITWRKYFKLAGVSMIIGMMITAATWMTSGITFDDIKDYLKDMFHKN